MIHKIEIDGFLELAKEHPILDVRSPVEYDYAHIPGAYNLPLFSNDERKHVGSIYKQRGRKDAIKVGLRYFGVKMAGMVEQAEKVKKEHTGTTQDNNVILHCWRGGMRSSGVAWLLDLYGFNVYVLSGGYKSFRNWALDRFTIPYPLKIIGGYTGSGKTAILNELGIRNHKVIDLEAIACHKGSAFGGIGEVPQPSQEMFENKLAMELHCISADSQQEPIWIEDESRRIGSVNLPDPFWETLKCSPVYFFSIPFEQRLDYILETYGKFKREELVNAIIRIQKRLGGLNAKNAVNYLLEDNYRECFRILLHYYDKCYEKGLKEKAGLNDLLSVINTGQVDARINVNKLLL